MAKGAKLLLAGDRLIALNDQGSLIVAQLSETGPELLAATRVFRRAGRNWTAPILANGRIYCRGGRNGDLVCLDVSD